MERVRKALSWRRLSTFRLVLLVAALVRKLSIIYSQPLPKPFWMQAAIVALAALRRSPRPWAAQGAAAAAAGEQQLPPLPSGSNATIFVSIGAYRDSQWVQQRVCWGGGPAGGPATWVII